MTKDWISQSKLNKSDNNQYNNSDSSRNASRHTRGQVIMQVADALYPSLLRKMKGYRDGEDMPLAPARIKGMALIIAQELVKSAEAKVA